MIEIREQLDNFEAELIVSNPGFVGITHYKELDTIEDKEIGYILLDDPESSSIVKHRYFVK